jgi:small subunit ribosomal protein S4
MGHPKKQRKKYETPKKPWAKKALEEERKVLQDFGLRRKHELWRMESILRNFRRRARELQAVRDEKKQKDLFDKMNKLGIRCSSLDDVLSIKIENILSRRLQTVVYKKGLANTPRHARQLIVHGHILINNRKMLWPSYIVRQAEEDGISLNPVLSAKIISAQAKAVKGG